MVLTCEGRIDDCYSELKEIDQVCTFFQQITGNFLTRIKYSNKCDVETYKVLSSAAKNVKQVIDWEDGITSNQYQETFVNNGNEIEFSSVDQYLTKSSGLCPKIVSYKIKNPKAAIAQFETTTYTASIIENNMEKHINLPLLQFNAKLSTLEGGTSLIIRGSGSPYTGFEEKSNESEAQNINAAYFCSSLIYKNAESFLISRPHFSCTYTKCDDVKTKINSQILMIPFPSTYNMCKDIVNYDFTKFCNQYSESDVGGTIKFYSNRKKSTLVALKTVKVVCATTVDTYVLISTYIKI